MIVYIDKDFKCHTQSDGTMVAVDVPFFDDKCTEYIEGYIFVPPGSVWVRENGDEYHREVAVPWKPCAELDRAQRAYEKQLLAEYEAALKTVGVSL